MNNNNVNRRFAGSELKPSLACDARSANDGRSMGDDETQ